MEKVKNALLAFFKGAWAFIKSEAVLCIAVLLAIISACIVPPDGGYADYVDWDTLALLFALMGVEGCDGRETDPERFHLAWQDYRVSPMAASSLPSSALSSVLLPAL